MKIINNNSGKAYHLLPGAELECERTNTFFNDLGEQTLPLDLPDTELNRQLLGFPDHVGIKAKVSRNIEATIEEGDYHMPCRQAILGAKRNEKISTSFYMNEGAFFSQIPDAKLYTIFGDEKVPGISTVADAINFCKTLLTTNDERFSIFPILIDEDSKKKWINRVEYMKADGTIHYSGRQDNLADYTIGLYNQIDRVESTDDKVIRLAAGYYISPFIKANYLLKRMFAYFGYTLKDNFFTQTYPFTDMVFINNTMDTLANGWIKFADVVPNCSCSTILNVFRKKFNCEFIPDEINKTVDIQLFKDVNAKKASIDLSSCLTSKLEISYPEAYKQVKIYSEEAASDDSDSFDSIPDMITKYPTAYFNKVDSAYYRIGFKNSWQVTEKIASSSTPYRAEGDLEDIEISVPDKAVVMCSEQLLYLDSNGRYKDNTVRGDQILPYIGESNSLNSTIVMDNASNTTDDETQKTSTKTTTEQKPMLAFTYDSGLGFKYGTISNYNYNGTVKLSDYTLAYNGPDGIFERFYRDYDNLYRNSMHTVKANLLLSAAQKQSIPANDKIIISGHELFINDLKYKIGGKNEPKESEFFTTNLYEPLDVAISEANRFPTPSYKWSPKYTTENVTKEQYEASIYRVTTVPTIYPPNPTLSQFQAGGQYYKNTVCYYQTDSNGVLHYYLTTTWLEAVAY